MRPWPWLRHIIPWWVLEWIDGHCDVCWENVVTWKIEGGECPWAVDTSCRDDFKRTGTCYCGKMHRDRP